jgi:hypothetical protein
VPSGGTELSTPKTMPHASIVTKPFLENGKTVASTRLCAKVFLARCIMMG